MIDDILDNFSTDCDENALDRTDVTSNDLMGMNHNINAPIFSSSMFEDNFSLSLNQPDFSTTQEGTSLDLYPDSINSELSQEFDNSIDSRFPNEGEYGLSDGYLDTSNQIDIDNLINIPHTDGLELSREDIDQLSRRAEDIDRDTHRNDISFGKKGDPGECCTRHCCTGASYCDASYGDFHR